MDLKLADSDNLNEFFNELKNHAKDLEEYMYIGRHATRYKSIWGVLEDLDFISVLDIGCGRGHFGLLLKSMGKSYVGVDMSESVKICKERGLEAYSADVEKEKLPFETNSFDMVLCLEVIEHFNNTEFLLSEIRRVIKNKGFLIISTPNVFMPSWRIRELIFRNNKVRELITGSNRINEDYKHSKLFNRTELIKILNSSGFEVLLSNYIRIFFPFDDILVIGSKTI